MKNKAIVLTGLLLASSSALAQVYQLETIEVRPVGGDLMQFGCSTQYTPKPVDVEKLLQINDPTQTPQLSKKLMEAVGQACAAGVSQIVVERGQAGKSVVWYPVGYDPVVSGPYVVPVR